MPIEMRAIPDLAARIAPFRWHIEFLFPGKDIIELMPTLAAVKVPISIALQHIMTVLAENGRAGVVLPDNVLFEGGAGETIRRRLLKNFDFHTLLRLPTGIFYKQGVKANVMFFDKKPVSEKDNTKELWIYDLRTNQRFTLKERPMVRADLDDFVACYASGERRKRKETERFRRFAYADLVARDKVNLDIFWLKDDTLDDPDLLPPPEEVAAGIVENLETALERFRRVANALGRS
jgi:type I restriction enzyme M protein